MHIEKWKTDKVMRLKTVRIDIYKVMVFFFFNETGSKCVTAKVDRTLKNVIE